MTAKTLLFSLILAIPGISISAQQSVPASSLGIGQDAVFGEPEPTAYDYPKTKAGKADRINRAYSTAPPQVPHKVDSYLPVSMEENKCLDCHDKPKRIGKPYKKGQKLPMPKSHYGGFSGNGDMKTVSGARYNCTQCHVPMSDAKPLVDSTF